MWRWWPTSRILDLLSAIKNGTTYTAETYSRIEAILKSMANGTSYSEESRSRHEELLLAIKNGESTSMTPRTNIEELLCAIANGTLDTYLVGKNLFDINKVVINSYTMVIDDSIVVKNNSFYVEIPVHLLSGDYVTTYEIQTPSTDVGSKTYRFKYVDNSLSQTAYSGVSITANQEVASILIYVSWGTYVNEAIIKDIKLEVGSTATPYSDYCFKSDLEEAYCESLGDSNE